ncbi:unnamed protein product [Cylindrotheca closterium]|uniref:Uncharacterized protein n=1 Tax=Cylindrotheca closterium TaxID=2856 RepID=A0AAD2PVC4_9STRA|nr:unnamed protein product [Cylindrotheca closterium]
MTRLPRTSLFLCLFLVSTITSPVHGFASWLRCYVELETDEVVMNHHIQPSTVAEHDIPIQVQNSNDGTWSSTVPSTIIQPTATAKTTTTTTTTLQIRLELPQELIRQDVQWVIEVTPEGAAEFVGNGRMCEGTRAHSRNEEPVTLTIKDGSTPLKLVAGYAAGHEAVVLTPPMHIGGQLLDEL